ncbi:hypothetical protein HDU98_000086 [Podochytrium sp. JEL0797]|nr:hypothetical protein HDU98_000086 [Podochytrium sp. JEL0797]
MMDELPMVIGLCLQLYCMLLIFPAANTQPYPIIYGSIISLTAAFVSILYLWNQNPVFHEVCIAILAATMMFLTPFHIHHLRNQHPQVSPHLPGLFKIYFTPVASIIIGFALWGIENNYCESFRAWRETVGFPWSVLSEFHVYWHFGSALSVYLTNLRVCWMRELAKGREDVVVVFWGGVFATLERKETMEQGRWQSKKSV